MDPVALNRSNRMAALEQRVLDEGTVSIQLLADEFDVSVMTIRRDVDALQRRGAIRRSRGMVTALSSLVLESDMRYRATHALTEKRAIASAAAKQVEPGQAIMLDDSSTASLLAEPICKIPQTTIITNSAALLSATVFTGTRFVSLGGEYQARYQAFSGLMTEINIGNLTPHLVFMSASAVQGGVAYHPDEDMVRVKRAMLRSASKRVLLVDSGKMQRKALHRIAPLSEFDQVITDGGIDPAIEAQLRDQGVQLTIARETQSR